MIITGYKSITETRHTAGLVISVKNTSPQYFSEERKIVKKELEHKLYDIFRKYF